MQGILRKEMFLLTPGLRVQAIIMRGHSSRSSRHLELALGIQEAEKAECSAGIHISLLPRISSCEAMPLAISVGCVNEPHQGNPQRYTQRFILQVILDPVKLASCINHTASVFCPRIPCRIERYFIYITQWSHFSCGNLSHFSGFLLTLRIWRSTVEVYCG